MSVALHDLAFNFKEQLIVSFKVWYTTILVMLHLMAVPVHYSTFRHCYVQKWNDAVKTNKKIPCKKLLLHNAREALAKY